MKVQDYIEKNGLEKLQEEFSIMVTDYPDRVVLNYNQIESPRFHPICDECRALILRKGTWEVMARSFDRFYNVGEGEAWKTFPIESARIEEKLDGSLLSVYHDGEKWCASTRKMAFAEGQLAIGIEFKELFDKAVEGTNVMKVLEEGSYTTPPDRYTWVFELTAPENRIVTPYSDRKVTLIGARHNGSQNEMLPECLDEIARDMGVARPKRFECKTIEELQQKAQELNVMDEGFVLVVDQAEGSHWRLKCKNPKYVAIAHMRENGNISPKRIMTLIIANEHHEYLQYFECDKPYFDMVESVYSESISRIEYLANLHMYIDDQKEFALTIMPKTKYAYEKGVLFRMRKGEQLSDILRDMGGKKLSEALKLKDKFSKEFGIGTKDES